MSKKPTPEPQSQFLGSGAGMVLFLALPFIALWLIFDRWWLLIPALPLWIYALRLLYAMVLLIAAGLHWHRSNIRGIVVWSDSPHWKEYIEDRWLRRLADQVVLLNWSERHTWRFSLPVLLFRHFGLGDGNLRNFTPLCIVFRGLRYPLIYRYFYAFRDARHGRPEALERLEKHMFAALNCISEKEEDNPRALDKLENDFKYCRGPSRGSPMARSEKFNYPGRMTRSIT